MTLQEYRDAYLNDADYFEKPTKELAIAWLDAKIDALEHLDRIYRNQGYNLEWGEFDVHKGEFPNSIEICGFNGNLFRRVHIYNGIEKLAEILGTGLATETDSNGINYYFLYKGYKVFQIGADK